MQAKGLTHFNSYPCGQTVWEDPRNQSSATEGSDFVGLRCSYQSQSTHSILTTTKKIHLRLITPAAEIEVLARSMRLLMMQDPLHNLPMQAGPVHAIGIME